LTCLVESVWGVRKNFNRTPATGAKKGVKRKGEGGTKCTVQDFFAKGGGKRRNRIDTLTRRDGEREEKGGTGKIGAEREW